MTPTLALDVSPDAVEAKAVEAVSVAEEMSDSFLAYALSVITARAIPDVRDGLKPVQRRVLWSMQQMGVRPGTPYRKSARIVGDTMGRFHPHGDAAIYDTLVRLGQDFGRMVPLIEPQGNFGSLDDPPAASRYTECRLSEAAMAMLRHSDEDTVDFRPTYDGEDVEPSVLPAALPNLLVNGTSGIAVGMATNMWPHNLAEAAECIKVVLKSRSATGGKRPSIDRLMEVMPGPDFPGGGIVLSGDGIKEAYATGRGMVRMRARTHLEDLTKRRRAIIVTELPYLVGPEQVVARVTALIAESKLDGVRGVADLSDVEGLRLSIELKPGANPTAVLNHLYQTTPLEQSRSVNCVALVDGVPTTLHLVEICEHYIRHRLEVIVRRTKHRISKAEARLHVVDGLLIALSAIDEVVSIIRSSKEANEAKTKLIEKLNLSDVQATHILDMPLRRLTSLERSRLDKEAKALRTELDKLRSILASDRKRHNIVANELDEVVGQHGTPRRSEFRSEESEVAPAPTATPAGDRGLGYPCVVTLSTSGNIGVAAVTETKRGRPGRHDLVSHRVDATSVGMISAISSQGEIHHASVAELADANTRTRGTAAKQVFGLKGATDVVALVPAESSSPFILLTNQGNIKRIRAADALGAHDGSAVVALGKNESVVAALEHQDGRDVVVVSSDGQVMRFSADDLSPRTLASGPVACMKLKAGERVVGAGVADEDAVVFFGTDAGAAKSVAVRDLPKKGRRGMGVRGLVVRGDERVATCGIGHPDALAAITEDDPSPKVVEMAPSARAHAPQRKGIIYKAVGEVR